MPDLGHLVRTSNPLSLVLVPWILAAVLGGLVLAPLVALAIGRIARSPSASEGMQNFWRRYRTWLLLAPALILPILWCPLAAMVLVLAASLVCYREFARATGLFRFRLQSALVTLGIFLAFFAAADHWPGLFFALPPLMLTLLAGVGVLPDEPKGYLQRVALAAVAFLLFGSGLGHLALFANDPRSRELLCTILFCTQLSDIAAYVCGKALGRRKLFPNTSPHKTAAGHLGALLVVTPLAAVLFHLVFRDTPLASPRHALTLALILALGAQLGDLVLSSFKRDLNLKDMAATLPGHGGFLDRFNSVLLVAPALYHYANWILPTAKDLPKHTILNALGL